jgi:hypothetical protein
MYRLIHALLMLGCVLLFVVGCSQNQGSSPVAPEMDNAPEKSMAVETGEMPMGLDVSGMESTEELGIETAEDLMGMAVTPLAKTVLCGEDHTMNARVYMGGYPETIPITGQKVDFIVIEGPNAGAAATVTTDAFGQATFTYFGFGGLGTDHISVTARHLKTGETINYMITVTWMNSAPTLEVREEPLFVDQDNHKYITITPDMVIERAENVFGQPTSLAAVTVVSVSSDEPEDHIGDGSTVDDILIECPNLVMLRTERMGGEEGRVYTVRYRLTDANGRTADDILRVVIIKGNSDPNLVLYHRTEGYTVSPGCVGKEIDNPF